MEVLIGGKTRSVEIERKRMKNMYLRVREDGTLYVTCPKLMSEARIREFIYSREAWILEAMLKQERKERIHQEGVNGPIVYWFGRKTFVRYETGKRDRAELDGDILTFYLKEITDERIQKTFRKFANEVLLARMNEYRHQWDAAICDPRGIPYPELKVKYMTSRWGVCYPGKHLITLSTRLIHYPEVCLQSVLLHEYAHLLVPNHSRDFYRAVYALMPEYDTYDRLLK